MPDGEVGELYSRTPYVFDGYWKNPEKTAEAFRGAWCSVGDMARRDADGYYHLVDRKSNMIISGGENIYPSEVESLLAGHPAVQDVARGRRARRQVGRGRARGRRAARPGASAYGGRDPRRGAATGSPATSGRVRSRSSHEAQMPRTATGKIQHRLLRDLLPKP